MFDFAWTQIGLIGVVALVLIGPKDLPIAIKAVAGFVKKARRMAGEFQGHVDDMVKDTELAELRNQISDIRSFDIRREVERAVDPDGTLKAGLRQDPFRDSPPRPAPSIVTGGLAASAGDVLMTPHDRPAPPAFIPPEMAAILPVGAGDAAPPAAAAAPGPPAFIPPAVAHAVPPDASPAS